MHPGGGTRVLPATPSGPRRCKAPVPWRFGYVWSETPEVSRSTVAGSGGSVSLSDGDLGLGDEVSMGGGVGVGGEVSKGGGGGVGIGGGCGLDSLGGSAVADDEGVQRQQSKEGAEVFNGGDGGIRGDSSAAADEGESLPKDSRFVHSDDKGTENNAATSDMLDTAAPPSNPQAFQFHGAADDLRAGDGCPKRLNCKVVVQWRFQNVYRPKRMSSGKGRKQRAPAAAAAASPRPRGIKESAVREHPFKVKTSAGRKRRRPSVKVEKGTGSVAKKRKTNKKRKTSKDGNSQAVPNSRVPLLVPENARTTLKEFRIIYKKLLEDEETKQRENGHGYRPSADVTAFKLYKERFCVQYGDQRYVGSVPGVCIGDIFDSNMELYVVGIHRARFSPVDHIDKADGTCLAVSLVSYTTPSAWNHNLDFFLHVGMVAANDQSIKGTGLALKHSMDSGTPVRVIHGILNEPAGGNTYVYGGLYLVEKFRIEKIRGDQCVNTFHLRRMAGQQHIDIYEVLQTRSGETSDGIFLADISGGLEKMPISAINTISNEYPMALQYMSQIQYPLEYQPDRPPSGCDCVDGCSYSKRCACAMKNGGSFPFSPMGLLEERPLIYECGPSRKCPPTCLNRVSQHGIKFRLQVFKTELMGWGVRCLDFIPSGSFVCEYVGEMLEDQEAQGRMSDEYIFAIGNNYYDVPHWEGMRKKIPSLKDGPSEGDDTVFAIDAVNLGNFVRFINHSCSPNLFPQNVLYDHDDKRMPHLMFFASEDIPPLKELAYDYNYPLDGVYDSDGNIKKKQCFCGSSVCSGRLY